MLADAKTALITGAGHGIGRATAKHLAARGWIVGVNDLREEFVTDAVAEITQAGGRAFPVVQNVASREGVQAAIDTVMAQAGRLDGLVEACPALHMSGETPRVPAPPPKRLV